MSGHDSFNSSCLIQVNVFNSWGKSLPLLLLRKKKSKFRMHPLFSPDVEHFTAGSLRPLSAAKSVSASKMFSASLSFARPCRVLEGSTGISQRPLKPLPSHIPELATLFFYRVLISTCSESSNAHLQAVHAVWSEIRKYIRFGILAGPLRFARMVIANAVSA